MKSSKERLTDIRHFARMVEEESIGGPRTAEECKVKREAVVAAYAVVEKNEEEVERELAWLRKLAGEVSNG